VQNGCAMQMYCGCTFTGVHPLLLLSSPGSYISDVCWRTTWCGEVIKEIIVDVDVGVMKFMSDD
jgi:hypothetical protein